MRNKPSQITGGIYHGNGHENSYWHSFYATPQNAFDGFRTSAGHNNLMLNINGWESQTFRGMGVAIEGNHAHVWFGTLSDPQGTLSACVLDSDNDGVLDDVDAFPNDPSETTDNDGDGIGDNADADDDNDGVPDTSEVLMGSDPLSAASKPAGHVFSGNFEG